MSRLVAEPPFSTSEPVTEVLHGISVTDPYRWLEEQNSPRTRNWIEQQTRYTRAYLGDIPGRETIRSRIRRFLSVETCDSLHKVGNRYFFRKRLARQEQPCIYMREGAEGADQLLVDPSQRGTGKYTAVRLLYVSPDTRFLLYEVKEGGARAGTFECLEIDARRPLPDILPRGFLRGFAFAPDGRSFYYVHEPASCPRAIRRTAFQHLLGTAFSEDREIFSAGDGEKVRLCLISGGGHLGFIVYQFLEKTLTDFYLKPFDSEGPSVAVLSNAPYMFSPRLVPGRILALTDRDAPNLRIIQIRLRSDGEAEWVDLVPETQDRINGWVVAADRIVVSRMRRTATHIAIFDFRACTTGRIPVQDAETVRLIGGSHESDEVLIEAESLTEPLGIFRYSQASGNRTRWTSGHISFASAEYGHRQVWYTSRDGTEIPMFLMGRRDVLDGGVRPTIMTAYGGYGVSMTPQFSIFVAFLAERGCLFALPNIRGGSEFGVEWHNAARRQNRQTAYDDFLSAAEWLIDSGRSTPDRFAIFGGSNAGLLVGAALTQRPELFRAVVCMAPILDMLRYHHFDSAALWRDEYGTADDPDDFRVLAGYSPYHRIRSGVAYPATLFVSGDADKTCNSLHARKMTARLQAANASPYPIILDYSEHRGHSPVLPLSERIESLTDRMAFLCDQLQLPDC